MLLGGIDYSLTNLGETIEAWQLDGIECELRGIQHFWGPASASVWWYKNFSKKFPDYRYDSTEERVVRK